MPLEKFHENSNPLHNIMLANLAEWHYSYSFLGNGLTAGSKQKQLIQSYPCG